MPDHARLIHQLELASPLRDADKELIRGLPLRITKVDAKRDIVSEGARDKELCVVLDGVLCRYKKLGNTRRQILSLHLAGDIPNLQSLYLDHVDHSIGALTRARVAFIDHDALRALAAAHPSIALALAKHALVDASILREWIVNNGRRLALQRVAHLLCEVHTRETLIGLNGDMMVLPLTQNDLADATGLSVVHVNRVLQKLRHDGLIESKGSHHEVTDWVGLQQAGDFNPRYLHLRSSYRDLGL